MVINSAMHWVLYRLKDLYGMVVQKYMPLSWKFSEKPFLNLSCSDSSFLQCFQPHIYTVSVNIIFK